MPKVFFIALLLLFGIPYRSSDASDSEMYSRSTRQAGENSLLTSSSQLTPLSHIINALYLSSHLATSPKDTDAILAELIYVRDVFVLESLQSLHLDGVLEVVKEYRSLTVSLPDDLMAAMKVLVELKTRHSELPDWETTVSTTRSLVSAVEDLTDVDFEKVTSFPTAYFSRDLNEMFTKSGLDADRIKRLIDDTKNNEVELKEAVESLLNFKSNTADIIVDGSVELRFLKKWASFLNFYQQNKQALNALSKDFQSSTSHLKVFLNTVSASAPDDKFAEEVRKLQVFFAKFKSDKKPQARFHTTSFPNGAKDLSLIFEDLNDPWIKKAFGNSKFEKIRSTIDLFEKVLSKITSLGGELEKLPVGATKLAEKMTVMTRDLENLKVNSEKSRTGLETAFKNIVDVALVDDKQLSSALSRMTALASMLIQMSRVVADPDFEVLFNLKNLVTAIEVPKNATDDDVVTTLKKLRENKDVKDTIAKMHKASPLFHEIQNILRGVVRESHRSSDALSVIESSRTTCEDARSSLNFFLKGLESEGSFASLLSGFHIAVKLRESSDGGNFYENTFNMVKGVQSAAKSLKMIKRNIKELPTKPGELLLEKFTDVRKVSEVLGMGNQMMEDLGKAMTKTKHLMTVAQNWEAVDSEVRNVRNQTIKDDIEKRWTDPKKIKESLETLVADLTKLAKEIPATGASDIAAIGSILAKLNTVKDPELNLKEIHSAVRLLRLEVANQKVVDVEVALVHLAGLDLNFTSRSAALIDPPISIAALEKFLNTIGSPEQDLTMKTNVTSSETSSTPQVFSNSGSSSDMIIFIAIGGFFVVGFLSGIVHWGLGYKICGKKTNDVTARKNEKRQPKNSEEPTMKLEMPAHQLEKLGKGKGKPSEEGPKKQKQQPPSVKLNPKFRAQLLETQANLAKLRAHIERTTAQQKSDARTSKFIKKGPIYIPMEPDLQPAAVLPDNIILENVTYDPTGNEMFNIGSDVDDIEMDTSLTLDAGPTLTEEESKTNVNGKGNRKSKKSTDSKKSKDSKKSEDSKAPKGSKSPNETSKN